MMNLVKTRTLLSLSISGVRTVRAVRTFILFNSEVTKRKVAETLSKDAST